MLATGPEKLLRKLLGSHGSSNPPQPKCLCALRPPLAMPRPHPALSAPIQLCNKQLLSTMSPVTSVDDHHYEIGSLSVVTVMPKCAKRVESLWRWHQTVWAAVIHLSLLRRPALLQSCSVAALTAPTVLVGLTPADLKAVPHAGVNSCGGKCCDPTDSCVQPKSCSREDSSAFCCAGTSCGDNCCGTGYDCVTTTVGRTTTKQCMLSCASLDLHSLPPTDLRSRIPGVFVSHYPEIPVAFINTEIHHVHRIGETVLQTGPPATCTGRTLLLRPDAVSQAAQAPRRRRSAARATRRLAATPTHASSLTAATGPTRLRTAAPVRCSASC